MTPPGLEGEAESAPSCSLVVTRAESLRFEEIADKPERPHPCNVRSNVCSSSATSNGSVEAALFEALKSWETAKSPRNLRRALIVILQLLETESGGY